MSPRTLQMGGWILLIASAISLVNVVLSFVIPGPAGPNGPSSNIVSVVNIVAGILFLVSLPVAYIKQSKQVGMLGLIGFIALWLTALLFDIVLNIISIIVISSNQATVFTGPPPPPIFALFIIGTVLELIAGILLGLKTIQARVFPALIGWLLIVSTVLSVVGFPLEGNISTIVNTLSIVLLFVSLGWLGYVVATQMSEASVQSESTATGAGQ